MLVRERLGSRKNRVCQCLALPCVLLQVAAAYGCHCFIAMPDDAAIEKAQLLQALGELQPVAQVAAALGTQPQTQRRVTSRTVFLNAMLHKG